VAMRNREKAVSMAKEIEQLLTESGHYAAG
jgi:hypothetical protein